MLFLLQQVYHWWFISFILINAQNNLAYGLYFFFPCDLHYFSFGKLVERYQIHNEEEIGASKDAGGTDKVSRTFYSAQNYFEITRKMLNCRLNSAIC